MLFTKNTIKNISRFIAICMLTISSLVLISGTTALAAKSSRGGGKKDRTNNTDTVGTSTPVEPQRNPPQNSPDSAAPEFDGFSGNSGFGSGPDDFGDSYSIKTTLTPDTVSQNPYLNSDIVVGSDGSIALSTPNVSYGLWEKLSETITNWSKGGQNHSSPSSGQLFESVVFKQWIEEVLPNKIMTASKSTEGSLSVNSLQALTQVTSILKIDLVDKTHLKQVATTVVSFESEPKHELSVIQIKLNPSLSLILFINVSKNTNTTVARAYILPTKVLNHPWLLTNRIENLAAMLKSYTFIQSDIRIINATNHIIVRTRNLATEQQISYDSKAVITENAKLQSRSLLNKTLCKSFF